VWLPLGAGHFSGAEENQVTPARSAYREHPDCFLRGCHALSRMGPQRDGVSLRLAGTVDRGHVAEEGQVVSGPACRRLASRERLHTDRVQRDATGTWRVTLDIDSAASPVHGGQAQSASNGPFESVGSHPLCGFNEDGDGLAATLRPGDVQRTDGWDAVRLPVLDRLRHRCQPVVVRAAAACALPVLYEVLERAIEAVRTRPRGRPSAAPLVRYRSVHDQAASWHRPRRVIAKVEHHLGALVPRVGFIVTTLTGTHRAIVGFSTQRGPAEQWITEGTTATRWTGVRAIGVGPTRSACCLGGSPITSALCCAGWCCPSPSRAGPSGASSGGCARRADASSGMPGTVTLQLAERSLTRPLFRQIVARIE
jgi:hypothetical protein